MSGRFQCHGLCQLLGMVRRDTTMQLKAVLRMAEDKIADPPSQALSNCNPDSFDIALGDRLINLHQIFRRHFVSPMRTAEQVIGSDRATR